MSIILSKREFLKGLFAAPALVAATSIMPIKPTAAGIFKLESFSEIPTFDTWCLIKERYGDYAWMMQSDVEIYNGTFDVINEVKMPVLPTEFKAQSQFTVDLMKKHPGIVVYGLPAHFKKSLII